MKHLESSEKSVHSASQAVLFWTCFVTSIAVRAENNPYVGQCLPPWPAPIANIDAKEAQINRHIDIIEHWISWDQTFNQISDITESVYNNGSTLELTWQPMNGSTAIPNSAINNGSKDAYIRQYAQEVTAWGKPIEIRLMHEMNGSWFGWSPGKNGNTTETFKAAWKHVVDIFRQEGAINARWVYSVSWQNHAPNTFMGQYPGDDYVDFMSIDGYNWGNRTNWSHWQMFGEAFGFAYPEISSAGKPVIISEWACVEGGGNKAAWIADAFNQIRFSGNYDLIYAVLWFDLHQGANDFEINSSAAALEAYKNAINYESNPATKLDGTKIKEDVYSQGIRNNSNTCNRLSAPADAAGAFDLRGRIVPLVLTGSQSMNIVRRMGTTNLSVMRFEK